MEIDLHLWRLAVLIWQTNCTSNVSANVNRQFQGYRGGVLGADMKIELENDGPFTIVLDSEKLCEIAGKNRT